MHIAYCEDLSLGAEEWISLSKPAKVFKRCYNPLYDTLVNIEPITMEQVKLAHDPAWASAVFSCREQNGFGDKRIDVMKQVRYANGALLSAARTALITGICFSPVSGFHHAGYNFNGGFCTFNGLIITLQELKNAGKINSALILDFDGHNGNGTVDIIETLRLDWIHHMTRDDPFMEAEQSIIDAGKAILAYPDIVIYQAGADSHIDDSFGAGYFSTAQWKKRDRLIFNACHQLGVPIVWNLAGGYSGESTFKLHHSTYLAACQIYEPERQTSEMLLN